VEQFRPQLGFLCLRPPFLSTIPNKESASDLCYASYVANPVHLAKLWEGSTALNHWREQNPNLELDLMNADLRRVDLSEMNLTSASLFGSNLSKASLSRADLSGANLSRAHIGGANLSDANLTGAKLNGSKLSVAELYRANLLGADLRSANLQGTNFENAVLTDAKLWESQRAGWSIKGVICERAYWDEAAERPTEYGAGDFEYLYSEQTIIELHYPGGISAFELSTLPALLHHLSQRHEGTTIRLKIVEQTGGGAKVTLTIGDVDDAVRAQIESEATELVRTQLRFRDDQALSLQIENATLKQLHETTIRMMLTAGAPQAHFHGPVGIAALPSGGATVQANQSISDNTELVQLLEKLLLRKPELTAAQAAEMEAAKVELQKNIPDKSVLARTLDFLKTLPKEAVLKGVGKLGEKAADADWSNLLHQLGELIHHLR
jgi:Pentapeptide repeats (8 copies)